MNLNDFDPNNFGRPSQPEWATYVPSRRHVKFKVHKQRSHALNAVGWSGLPAVLYHWEDGKWVEVFRRDEPLTRGTYPEICENCGKDTKRGTPTYTYNDGEFIWKGQENNRPYQVWICRDCWYLYRRNRKLPSSST